MTTSFFNDRISLIDDLIRNADEVTFNIEILCTLTLEQLQDLYSNLLFEDFEE